MPGHTKASTPNTIAASPLRASTHQFLERTGRTGPPTPALVFVVMNTPFLRFLPTAPPNLPSYSFWLIKSKYIRVKNAVKAAAM